GTQTHPDARLYGHPSQPRQTGMQGGEGHRRGDLAGLSRAHGAGDVWWVVEARGPYPAELRVVPRVFGAGLLRVALEPGVVARRRGPGDSARNGRGGRGNGTLGDELV